MLKKQITVVALSLVMAAPIAVDPQTSVTKEAMEIQKSAIVIDAHASFANNGGVVQVNFCSAFVDENYREASAAQPKVATLRSRPATINRKPPEQPLPISTMNASNESGPPEFHDRRSAL
jgi:hypothetical protein